MGLFKPVPGDAGSASSRVSRFLSRTAGNAHDRGVIQTDTRTFVVDVIHIRWLGVLEGVLLHPQTEQLVNDRENHRTHKQPDNP
jgi:hypothetical protein